jgi:hypothetical protein
MRRSMAILIAFFAASLAYCANISSQLQPETATIGDPLELVVRIEGANNRPVQSVIVDGDGFELLDIDSSTYSQDNILRFHYAVYDTGSYQSPELSFVIGQGANAETLSTESHQVRIYSVLPDTASAIRANKPNREPKFSLLDEVIEKGKWTLPLLLLAGAIYGVWWWIKRRKKAAGGLQEIPKIILPAHQIAVTELIALRDKKYPERGMLKEFYSEFSGIIRRYVENRYGFPALEMTTYELEYKFDAPEFPSLLIRRLLPALRESDLVKFAKYIPDPASCKQQLELGFEVVDATRERQEEQVSEAAAA